MTTKEEKQNAYFDFQNEIMEESKKYKIRNKCLAELLNTLSKYIYDEYCVKNKVDIFKRGPEDFLSNRIQNRNKKN